MGQDSLNPTIFFFFKIKHVTMSDKLVFRLYRSSSVISIPKHTLYTIFNLHPLEPSNDTIPLKEMEAVRGAVMKTLQFPEPGVDQDADVGECQLATTIIYVINSVVKGCNIHIKPRQSSSLSSGNVCYSGNSHPV